MHAFDFGTLTKDRLPDPPPEGCLKFARATLCATQEHYRAHLTQGTALPGRFCQSQRRGSPRCQSHDVSHSAHGAGSFVASREPARSALPSGSARSFAVGDSGVTPDSSGLVTGVDNARETVANPGRVRRHSHLALGGGRRRAAHHQPNRSLNGLMRADVAGCQSVAG
jgi:hypothetical protein